MNDLKFVQWTINAIKEGGVAMGWFDERRYDWCQIAHRFTSTIINGYTILLCTDSERQWFGDYVLQNINTRNGRPLIPISNLNEMLPKGIETDINLIEDMLEVAFGGRYVIWYIGYLNNRLAKLAIESNNSFIWSFEGDIKMAFNLKDNDNDNDIKLLQLFKILDKTIEAMMFNEINDQK